MVNGHLFIYLSVYSFLGAALKTCTVPGDGAMEGQVCQFHSHFLVARLPCRQVL